MNPKSIRVAALFLGVLACCVVQGDSRDDCCAMCGTSSSCRKICRLVKEEKSVEVVCWGCKCEDFCLPGPSCPGCEHCDMIDCTDPKGEICTQPKKFVWTEWIPGSCAKIFTRKKLMKKVTTQKIPSYKWVVEDLCPPCEGKADKVALEAGTDIPAPPKVPGVKVIAPAEASAVK